MIESYLNGDVPHSVMADWCEERGLPFPRSGPTTHRQRLRQIEDLRASSRSRSLSLHTARSQGRNDSTSGSSGRGHGVSMSASRISVWQSRRSVSGSRTEGLIASQSGSRPTPAGTYLAGG